MDISWAWMPKSYRRWIYEILEEENHANGWPNRVNLALMLLVVLNVGSCTYLTE
jgi:hypothetical protein